VSRVADGTTACFILASASPRRRDLLRSAGLSFDIEPGEIEESRHGDETPRQYVRRLAAQKARVVATRHRPADRRPILAADTVVLLEGELLEKPEHRQAARQMLGRLSGRWHEVMTGFCVIDGAGGEHLEEVVTRVRFKSLCAREIEAYLDVGEYRDKAGAYGVQGGAGYMVREISGSYTNVVGLPLCQVVEALQQLASGAA